MVNSIQTGSGLNISQFFGPPTKDHIPVIENAPSNGEIKNKDLEPKKCKT
jgi:hypothetical protein